MGMPVVVKQTREQFEAILAQAEEIARQLAQAHHAAYAPSRFLIEEGPISKVVLCDERQAVFVVEWVAANRRWGNMLLCTEFYRDKAYTADEVVATLLIETHRRWMSS
ncbi:MAG: hypothetical protein BWY43_00263 [candidate division WS2 bacterium ADurb.Bin280]|uniref:Uncharacterized protein n=1 Tax=candidate division WS2 bacterium ADurb.Bin280 TaxID=1852829 RepID=A0A1V5SET1_9BACT|nr:MAG: hypothetical protein BWY43_00263 [candidate division WS2 bacterium ADurb.Bin280]